MPNCEKSRCAGIVGLLWMNIDYVPSLKTNFQPRLHFVSGYGLIVQFANISIRVLRFDDHPHSISAR
jgi:hypothetical protein